MVQPITLLLKPPKTGALGEQMRINTEMVCVQPTLNVFTQMDIVLTVDVYAIEDFVGTNAIITVGIQWYCKLLL